MIPKSLSASAIAAFSSCEARYKAEWIDRTPAIDGDAALLGTTCHSALEDFVASGEAQRGEPLEVLEAHFTEHYWTNFDNDARLAEGLAMMATWHKRQDWSDIEVISTEVKECIMIPTSVGDIAFNFIIDRLDRIVSSGEIEVVDYKSNWVPMTFDDLRSLPQPQLYGMVARMKFPEAKAIWVRFDFLRHDPIAILVTREENRAAWEYLKRKAKAIIASDGTTETIGKDCGWCVRRHECTALTQHIAGGGVMALAEDIPAAAKRRMELSNAEKAIKTMIADLDTLITAHMEHEGQTEFETDEVTVALSAGRRREVNAGVVAKLIGTDTFAKYADLKVGQLEKMLKDEPVTPEQALAIEQQVSWRFNRVGVRVKPKGDIEVGE